MGKELKSITAKEARELADSSDFTAKHIYKVVRERALENATSILWSTYDLSEAALRVVISQLRKNGFTVKINKDDHSLIISW